MTAIASLRELLTRNLRQSGIYIAFVAIVALFAVITDDLGLRGVIQRIDDRAP